MRAIRAAAAATLSVVLFSAGAVGQPAAPQHPQVEIKTNVGSFVIELWPEHAPVSVSNFLFYVRTGFYDGTIFHRVIKNFVVQGGGRNEQLEDKKRRRPVPLEKSAKNEKWTVALARSTEPDSATSEFFINLRDNRTLDEAGYAVIGKVVDGTSVIEQIARVRVGRKGKGLEHLPLTNIVVESATLLAPPPVVLPSADVVKEDAEAAAEQGDGTGTAESGVPPAPTPEESPDASGGGR